MAFMEMLTRNVLYDSMYQADCSAGGGIVIFTADWHAIFECDRITAIVHSLTGAQALSAVTVRGATSVAGANPLTICTLTNPANINAADEMAFIEVSAAHLAYAYRAAMALDLTHVNIGVESIAGATPVVGTLIGHRCGYSYAGLTTPTESAWT